jgi:hypothetical protein
MKKVLLISSAVALTMFAACKKDKKTPTTEAPFTVEQKQNAAYMYFGGTWCGPCGAYGKPTKQALHENALNANAVFVSFQIQTGSDPFATTVTDATSGYFGVTGVPTAFIGGGSTFTKWGFSSNNASNISSQQNTFNAIYASTALVNGKATPTLTGNNLSVKCQNKFFDVCSDSLFVQAYLTESNLVATQYLDGSTKVNIHDFVWRNQSGTKFYGEFLSAGSTAGQVVEKTVNMVIQSTWTKTNCDVCVLIWRKKPTGFSIENCYKTKLIP